MSDTVNYQLLKSHARSKSHSSTKNTLINSIIRNQKDGVPKRKTRIELLAWRLERIKELFLNRQSMEEKGTPQRKVRWGRSAALKKSRLKRVRRDRVKRKISQGIDRRRRLKGRAHRTGRTRRTG